MTMLYELFHYVGRGHGDYGSEWKRIACCPSLDAAQRAADQQRTADRNGHYRLYTAPSHGIGRLVRDFPPLSA